MLNRSADQILHVSLENDVPGATCEDDGLGTVCCSERNLKNGLLSANEGTEELRVHTSLSRSLWEMKVKQCSRAASENPT